MKCGFARKCHVVILYPYHHARTWTQFPKLPLLLLLLHHTNWIFKFNDSRFQYNQTVIRIAIQNVFLFLRALCHKLNFIHISCMNYITYITVDRRSEENVIFYYSCWIFSLLLGVANSNLFSEKKQTKKIVTKRKIYLSNSRFCGSVIFCGFNTFISRQDRHKFNTQKLNRNNHFPTEI